MNNDYVYKFEDRIHKHKLPKGLSFVLQTTDISSILDTEGLSITYSYMADNPQKPEKSKSVVKDFSFTKVELLQYRKREHPWGAPGSLMDYNRHMSVYCVPGKIRWSLRAILRSDVLPRIQKLESRPEFSLSVYYKTFHKNSYDLLDWGGLYIEQDRYGDKAKVLYRNKEYDIDKELRSLFHEKV